jgi:hypothetical protein
VIRQLLNLEVSQVFSEAIVNVAILITEKANGRQEYATTNAVRVSNSIWDREEFGRFVQKHSFNIPREHFGNSQWSLEKPEVLAVRSKIEVGSQTLEQLGAKIRLGIATGCNEAFVVNSMKRQELIEQHESSRAIIVPLIRGRDIESYGKLNPKQYLIAAKNGVNVRRDYPAIYDHLLSFGEEFKNRGAQGENWWNLRACAFYNDFDKERIVWIELTDKARFTKCSGGIWCLNSAYFMLPPQGYSTNYLLALLNSRTIHFYFRLIAQTSGMGVPRWINLYVEKFPIPVPPREAGNRLERLVVDILSRKKADPEADTASLEKEIDQIVYKLYNLTSDEIAIVEGLNNIRY